MHDVVGVKKALVFSLLLSAIAAPAAASPIFWSQADVQAIVQHNDPTYPFTPVVVTNATGQVFATDSGVATATTAARFASAFGTAWVEDGTLHAFATGTGSYSNAFTQGLDGVALSRVTFFDTIIPVSATLAYGTPVTISFASALNYTLTGNSCTDRAQVESRTAVSGPITTGVVSSVRDSTCSLFDFTDFDLLTAQAVIGQEFTIQLSLSVLGFGKTGTATADAGNSLRLFMTPLGDFSLNSASGLDYSREVAAVPEPASLGLVSIGLLAIARVALAGRLRRRE